MSAGLKIFNDSGDIQIDQDYRNLHLRQITNITIGSYTDAYGYVIASGLDNPVFAYRPSFLFSAEKAVTKEFGGSTWYLEDLGAWTSSASVHVYIFDIGAPLAVDDYGLRVFDASGNLVFHSDGGQLVVRDVVTHGKNTTSNYTYDSGRVYAAIPLSGNWGYRFSEITDGIQISADNAGTTPAQAQFLIVDVTPY